MTEFEPDEGTEEADVTEDEETTEAEATEAEDGAAEDEAEAEETPEEPDALAQKQAQDAYTERVRKYLAKNMGEFYGEEAVKYTECPACNYTGTPGWLHISPCPPELLGFVYEWTNTRAPDEYAEDTHSKACEACNGLGSVATGSKVDGQQQLSCVECSGMGWLPTDDTRRSRTGLASNGLSASYPPVSAVASAVPETPVEEDPEVIRLRQLGYAVIPPMVVNG